MTGFFMLPDLHFTGSGDDWRDARHLPRQGLAQALVDCRNRTLGLLSSFGMQERSWRLLPSHEFSPPQWVLGHLAWYAEKWCLRDPRPMTSLSAGISHGTQIWEPTEPSALNGADAWFDADRIPPDARWEVALPDVAVIKQYAADTLERVLARIATLYDDGDATLYPFRLVLFRETLQTEALAAMLQALGRPLPGGMSRLSSTGEQGTLQLPGGRFVMGWNEPDGFAFDNERPPQRTYVQPFEIDAAPVTNRQFMEFVDDGGYDNPAWWSAAGQQWLMFQERSAPRYWSRQRHPDIAGRWQLQRFGEDVAVPLAEPVRHVSLFEAQAWCLWAGRRLPTEDEWEMAAVQNSAFRWGEVSEWTASVFEPYDGFEAGPDDTWSAPYFSTYQTVRGASWLTPAWFHHARFRLMVDPGSDGGWIGFRTCAV